MHRFTVVFDREDHYPSLFARLREKRVAILSYHKHPGPDWHPAEFGQYQVMLANGETVTLRLAERGTWLASGKLWVRELPRLVERDTAFCLTRNVPRKRPARSKSKANGLPESSGWRVRSPS